jgi:hypothetical protein
MVCLGFLKAPIVERLRDGASFLGSLMLRNGSDHMTPVSKKRVNSLARWAARFAVVALVYPLLSAGLWSSVGSAQETAREQEKALAQLSTEPKKRPRVPAANPPSSPKPTPGGPPASEGTSGGALAAALASCDKGADSSEPLTLPGAKGEVKLDRCYQGRDHLVCSLNAVLREAKALFDDYSKIVEANYPNVSNVDAICGIKPADLAEDLKKASAFDARFKTLKNEYGVRTNCAAKIEQSIRDVTLPDMVRAPDILKSMIDSMQGDMKDVAAVQKQVLDLAEKIDASQKAMVTIRKIHRTMCMRDQPGRGADEREPPGQRASEANRGVGKH